MRYDISFPRFRRILKQMIDEGFEIGLHASYNTWQGWERIAAERERLEQVAGQLVTGNRHHYWHMRHPFWHTLEAHERAGLRYDSSLAFNDAQGFRLGIAFPFHPWNPITARPVKTLQIPVMIMDGAYFVAQGLSIDESLEQFARLLDGLKRFEGVAAIDWHEYTSYPGSVWFKNLGEAYQAILKLLSADPEVGVQCCRDVLDRYGLPD